MSRRTVRRITLWLILGLVILGCGTPALVTTPPSISSDPGSIETRVAQTAAAAQAQTLTALPPTNTPTFTPVVTRTPTVSPTPTATFLFLFPTETSLPEGIFDDEDGNGDGDGNDGDQDGFVKPTATASAWDCRVLSKSPANDAVIVGGTQFQAIWTVQNTGTSTWPKQGVDVVLESGARLQVGKPYYDISRGVGPGGTLRISVLMEVPKREKDYNTRWSLKVGRTNFCSVRFEFSVK